MPLMKGRWPVRRTIKYLEKGNIYLKKNVTAITVNYNNKQGSSKGMYDFVFWHLPQLQYRNPSVQIVTLKNMTPSPFLQFFFDNGENMIMDCDSKSKEEIHNHLLNTVAKQKEVLQREEKEAKVNPANFGDRCERECICEVPGQVPCSRWVVLPKEMRGKHKKKWEEKEA